MQSQAMQINILTQAFQKWRVLELKYGIKQTDNHIRYPHDKYKPHENKRKDESNARQGRCADQPRIATRRNFING